MSTALDLLAFADSFAGFVEGPGNNETPFGEWAHAQFQPWCQSYASFCLDHVGLGIGKVSYCPTGVAWYRDHGQLHSTPEVGDEFYLWFPSKNRYAHTGFVRKVDGEWIITREGNSNAAGSRTGGACVTLRRQWAGTRTVFGRPHYTTAPAPKPEQPLPTPSVQEDPMVVIPAWAKPQQGRWPHFRLVPVTDDTSARVLAYPGAPLMSGLDKIASPKFTLGTGDGGIPMVTITGLPSRAMGLAQAPNGDIVVLCRKGETYTVAVKPA